MQQRRDLEDMPLARRYGRMLLAGAGVAALLYALGLARRSYWALAAPMTVMVGGALAAASVLGGLLATTPDEEPDPE